MPRSSTGAWSADHASADDLAGKLTCNYFVPGDGLATVNATESCVPAIDQVIGQADAEQASDLAVPATSWALE
jgi:hypothetical protein